MVALVAFVALSSPRAEATPVASDFNGDGSADLGIAVPLEDLGRVTNAGAVQVLYGSAAGFDGTNQFLTKNTPGVPGVPHAGDQLGLAGGIGDFNGDGFADLAIGVPGETVGGAPNAGEVVVFYGSAGGLFAPKQVVTVFTESSIGLDPSKAGDRFGAALGTGDYNGDKYDDLAVGTPGKDLGKGAPNAGAVTVLRGSYRGLISKGARRLTENDLAHSDGAEGGDRFGAAFAPYESNFNNDSFDDLAVGIPGEDVGGASDAGAVAVLYGSAAGPDPTSNQFWDQRPTDKPEPGDRFGASVAAGDFNGDGVDDMAVGAPGESLDGASAAGAVSVLRGKGGLGLTGSGAQFISQNSPGVANVAEPGDQFGLDLATGDLNGDGIDDLAIGTPGEGIAQVPKAGAVNVLYGSPEGPSGSGDQLWSQNSPGIRDVVEAGDRFGYSLAIGDFNGDGVDDLSVSVPLEDIGAIKDAGADNVIFGTAKIGLAANGNQFLNQNSPGILDKAEPSDCWACDEYP